MVVTRIGCQGGDMGDRRGYWMHMAAVCGGPSLQIVLKGVRSPPRQGEKKTFLGEGENISMSGYTLVPSSFPGSTNLPES
jgi:hypothetical protein